MLINEIEKALMELGLPETHVRFRDVLRALQVDAATLYGAARQGELAAVQSSGGHQTWTCTRRALATYYAGPGAQIWRTAQRVERQSHEPLAVDESAEEWRPLPRDVFSRFADLYEVSNHGRLRRIKGGQGTKLGAPTHGTQRSSGYFQFSLKAPPTESEKRQAEAVGRKATSFSETALAHRVVALAFLDRPKDWQNRQVDHIDGNRANNQSWNLQWVTPAENTLRAVQMGGHRRGLDNHATMLTDEQVREVVRLSEGGATGVAIAAKMGVTPGHISEILSGKKRADVTGRTPRGNF